MDANAILSKLKSAAPGKILESSPFGRSDTLSVWIEAGAAQAVAAAISADPQMRLDWLENFSVAEVGGAFVFTWFVRSSRGPMRVVIRTNIVPQSSDDIVDIQSVRETWKTTATMEDENAELFGLRFLNTKGEAIETPQNLLTDQSGFPLRKCFKVDRQKGARK